MSLGKKILVWFLVIVIIVVCILLIANFRFVKKVGELILSQAKSTFSVEYKGISPEESKRQLDNYRLYLENKELNSIFIELAEGFDSLNNQRSYLGSFPLDNEIVLKVNSEFKDLDITQYFKAGDIVKIIYSPYSIYIFIERYEADCGCFISYKEKVDIFT